MNVKCSECECMPQYCNRVTNTKTCELCTKDVCCCIAIHTNSVINESSSYANPTYIQVDDCCSTGICKSDIVDTKIPKTHFSWLSQFFRNVKGLYSAALGIEILCIGAAVIGENLGLYIFGFNTTGIPIAFAMGYALAGFTTFVTILGRYKYNEKIDSCCSFLEQDAKKGFILNLKNTFKNFASGLQKIPKLYGQPNLKQILKTSVFILVTAESACILTAETVDLVLYQYSILLAIPFALFVGTFTLVAQQAYKMLKLRS